MSLGENILNLRKKNGLSQEKLAEKVEVARQTISNWELGETSPNPNQLKLLSKALNVSIDELVNNEEFLNNKNERKDWEKNSYGYEYVSKIKIKNIPLIHVNLGLGHGIKKAKGIFAIGDIAKGIFAIGSVAMGLIALGAVSIGLISFGALALGLLLAIGGISIGSFSIGGISLGLFAIGGIAIGLYSIGGIAYAKFVAAGDYAYGYIGIGRHVNAVVEILENTLNPDEIKNIILKHFPNTWNFIIEILSNVTFKY